MTLREILLKTSDLEFDNGIFYQRGIPRPGEFEKSYIKQRQIENRLYDDDIVRVLPDIPSNHPLSFEWAKRKFAFDRLMSYLRRRCRGQSPTILDLGSGNGWLSNRLTFIDKSQVLGVDQNNTELLQAARLFQNRKNLSFAYMDIMKGPLPRYYFDYIILAASIQYFRNIDLLFTKLRELLSEKGEIHLLDSPVYKPGDVTAAENRSQEYFGAHYSELRNYYYHHSWESFRQFNHTILYDPGAIEYKLLSLVRPISPFPWLRFTFNQEIKTRPVQI